MDKKKKTNPERVRQAINPFRVETCSLVGIPGLSLRSNPWAGVSERLRCNAAQISERLRRFILISPSQKVLDWAAFYLIGFLPLCGNY
jgi:hypothetical protein